MRLLVEGKAIKFLCRKINQSKLRSIICVNSKEDLQKISNLKFDLKEYKNFRIFSPKLMLISMLGTTHINK